VFLAFDHARREVGTAYQSAWQHPYVERMIRTLREELLDHVIVLNQRLLERLLREYLLHYYHTARPHQGLIGEKPSLSTRAGERKLVSVPVAGGLDHRYYRAAAYPAGSS
jgi:transposase InsO family protein